MSRRGGGTPLFVQYGYVPQNRIWLSGSWVFNGVYNFTIKRLEQGAVFLNWKPFKECEDLRWAVYICNSNNCFPKYVHDFSVKNYLILYAKQNKSGSESSVLCLKQGSEMSNFCLKQGRGLKASAAHLYPDFSWVPLPPPPRLQLA